MQKPIRYYIVKGDDQPVVRTVSVTRLAAASAGPSAIQPEAEHATSSSGRRVPHPEVARRSVARLMRAAIRRNQSGQ